jgi:hypothetical protein
MFRLLYEVLSRKTDPVEARLKMLFILTRYRPSVTLVNRDTVNLNLFRLSEQLRFAFTVDGDKITPNLLFRRNPVPYLSSAGTKKRKKGKDFIRDFTVKTDITAREFCDCFDYYCEYYRNPAAAKPCIDSICTTLYGLGAPPSGQELTFGVFLWFSGIINFFYTHPVYSILFTSHETGDSGKITLGMTETHLSLIHEGYPADMNLIDFFNAQIKLLKDNIRAAIASGAKITDIAKKTGLSLSLISRLS